MLIDATHPEETRVVVLSGNRLEDLDIEAAHRKQIKGNIYLAKVTRVEPSLQAAFIEYGGNRHGFLAFNEIHPDYYQIPVADREALLAEQEAADKAAAEREEGASNAGEGQEVEVFGGDDGEDDLSHRPPAAYRRYKIQEVIKRRQILLVQVVKEERGNKGAALTTYISLAGRYCVLMPNTARGGGISRKIANGTDRKRLKKILAELEIPGGMAVIVRTAGAQRTKAEIKRDYEYLSRLWDTIRETTLRSVAPALIYEEGDLIKRSIRDLYGNDIDDIVIEGDEGYRSAKDFMKLLIPSHAKKVKPYKEPGMPLFHRFQVESQLDAMHSPTVQLKSGGYIVINPTEALVSIDVNSGRATRERNIEETALKTNLEAATEIARQLRLRDLAGLIVIDFIDMEVSRNQTQVERRLKESLKNDRARIQVGRISPFGLLEMSRQRLRPSLHETAFLTCPHCGGTGQRRSIESSALVVLRAIEEEGIRKRASAIQVTMPTEVALYLLNQKRIALGEIEARYGFTVAVAHDDSLIPPAHRIDRLKVEGAPEPVAERAEPARIPEDETVVAEPREETRREQRPEARPEGGQEAGEGENRRRRRRRRRGRRGEGHGESRTDEQPLPVMTPANALPGEGYDEALDLLEDEGEEDEIEGGAEASAGEEERRGRRRRRGRRGGRRRGRNGAEETAEAGETAALLPSPEAPVLLESPAEPVLLEQPEAEKKADEKRHRRRRRGPATAGETVEADTETPEVIYAGAPEPEVIYAGPPEPEVIVAGPPDEESKPKARRPRRRTKAEVEADAESAPESVPEPHPAPEPAAPPAKEEPKVDPAAARTEVIKVEAAATGDAPRKSGWWKR
jgi:ribonuclease E